MKKNTLVAMASIASLCFLMPSCSTNYFDQERYESIIDEVFPVDIIDKDHDWNLLRNITAVVDLTKAPPVNFVVNIYDKHPFDPSACKLATGSVNREGLLTFNVPKDKKYGELYATVDDGTLCVAQGYFPVDNDVVRISAGDEITALSPSEALSPEFTFCFEETFPEPGDFDYNDCVMGVTMTKSPKVLNGKGNFIDFTVRLRAVGGSKTIASAMRLAGVSKSDVVDTVAIINKSWDFFKYAVDYLEDPMGKVKTAMNGDAVIYLFNDAHYALNGGRLDETGTMVPHYTINTKAEKLMPEWESATPVSTTYRVSFKDEFVFNNFTFKDIDLFIITGYNMSYYETHIHSYVGVNVLNNYPCNIDYLPWALLVPDKFVYPNEGVCICKYTKDLNYFEGAYQMGSYSFGAWARAHNNSKACAWYHYPLESEVYPAN